MNLRPMIIAALIVAPVKVLAQTPVNADDWTLRAPVMVPPGVAGFVAIELTDEAIDAAQPGLGDLRIVDAAGYPVPHLVRRTIPAPAELVWATYPLINQTWVDGEYARAVVDFQSPKRIDRLRVETSGASFRRYALLEASYDGVSWETLDAMWLFRLPSDNAVFTEDTFRFTAAEFRYLRVTVSNMEDEPGQIDIAGIETARFETETPATTPIKVVVTVLPLGPDEKNISAFEIDLGHRNLSIAGISIDVPDPYFHRRYSLNGIETVQRPTETGTVDEIVEHPIACSGVFYRIRREDRVEEHVVTPDFHSPWRRLRLRIFHDDNPPLDLVPSRISATRFPFPSVIFDTKPGARYTLLAGNSTVAAPSYDLARSVANLGPANLPAAALGKGDTSAIEAMVPWDERFGWLVWIALIAAAGLMAALIYKNIRRLKQE